jgi:hypothetical protein
MLTFSLDVTATTAGVTTSAVNIPPGATIVGFEVSNTGDTNAVDQFALQGRTSSAAAWVAIKTGAEFDTEGQIAKFSSGSLQSTGTEAKNQATVNVEGLSHIRFFVACAAATTAVTVHGQVI